MTTTSSCVTNIEERTIKIEERVENIEQRVTKMESDVSFLRADVLETRLDLKGLASRFGVFEVEVAKRFGVVDVNIELVKTSVEQAKRWIIVSGVSAIVTLVSVLGSLIAIGHTLTWF